MTLYIILGVVSFLSLALNVFLGWYTVQVLRKLQFMSIALETLDDEIKSFDSHLAKIYELEMYYGDESLQNLIKHSKYLLSSFEEMRKDYEIFNGDITDEEYFDHIAEEEQENNEKTK